MSIRPLQDRVIVRRKEEERTSPGGIVLPDSATEKPTFGEIISVGPGKRSNDGTISPVGVNAGDTVLFGQYSGTKIKFEGEELLVMTEDDIMAVID